MNDALGTRPAAPPPLKPEVRAAIQDDLKPVRPVAPPWARFAAGAAAGLGLTAVGLVAVDLCGGGGPTSVLPVAWWAAALATLLPAALVLTGLVIREAGPRAPVRPATLVLSVSAAAVAFVVLALVASTFQPAAISMGLSAETTSLSKHLACLGIGLGLAAIPAAALIALLRGGYAPRPRRAAVTAGVAASLFALVVLELRCSDLSLTHKLAGHGGVALVLAFALAAGAAVLVGRRPRAI
jgi:hypothetical protein